MAEMTIDWLLIPLGFLFAVGVFCVGSVIWMTARIYGRVFRSLQGGGYQEASDGKG